jgi:hypothetical protein
VPGGAVVGRGCGWIVGVGATGTPVEAVEVDDGDDEDDEGPLAPGAEEVAPGSPEHAETGPRSRTAAASAALFDLTAQP